ncbi:hypothetical protein SLA2020_239700 [Shorea laevis]
MERDNIGIHLEGDNRGGSLRELLGDQDLGTIVLKEKKRQSVPDDALENHHLDHKAVGVLAVHGDQQWNAHDQSIGQSKE